MLKSADILIQRGELGKLMQVEYADSADLVQAIESAQTALRHLEKFPPRVPETATQQPEAQTEAAAEEPTVDLPTKGAPTPVKLSYLKIVAGETDAKAYRRAALIGARLVDAGLWNTGTPIEIHDAHATYQRIRNLDAPDFYTSHPVAVPVLACFGISSEPNPYRIDVPDCAYVAGQVIADDLAEHPDERYRQVGWLMGWLWSCSGNSSVDLN